MKRLLFIAVICLIPLQAYAFEDYIITSDKPVTSVISTDESTVFVQPFFTIDNGKNIIMLKAQKVGKAAVIIKINGREEAVNVDISSDKTILSPVDGLSYFSLDTPPRQIEEQPVQAPKMTDTPPEIRGTE